MRFCLFLYRHNELHQWTLPWPHTDTRVRKTGVSQLSHLSICLWALWFFSIAVLSALPFPGKGFWWISLYLVTKKMLGFAFVVHLPNSVFQFSRSFSKQQSSSFKLKSRWNTNHIICVKEQETLASSKVLQTKLVGAKLKRTRGNT